MPDTGDATGSFDPKRSAQDVYRAFQDNHVPILGLAKQTIIQHEGLPPTLRIQVRLDNGKPVISDASTLPEGESLPPADSVLTIDLTQANNSIGGYSWYASGTIDDLVTGLSPATATTIPDTNWGPLALNDPARRDEWNALLPQSAYDAVEKVKQRLAIHDGVVGRAVPATPRKMRPRRNRKALVAAAAAAVVLVGAGLAGAVMMSGGSSSNAGAQPASAKESASVPAAQSSPSVTTAPATNVSSATTASSSPSVTSAGTSPSTTAAAPSSIPPTPTTNVTISGSWVHDKPGVSSTVCATIRTNPAMPNANVTSTIVTTDGSVSGNPTVKATTDANGVAVVKFTVTQFGTYNIDGVVVIETPLRTASGVGTVTVTGLPGSGC